MIKDCSHYNQNKHTHNDKPLRMFINKAITNVHLHQQTHLRFAFLLSNNPSFFSFQKHTCFVIDNITQHFIFIFIHTYFVNMI